VRISHRVRVRGSCLPKDLRSLLYLARVNFLDLPLLSGTLVTNELSVRDVVDRVLATDARSIAILGLSFKMTTDDLRESPYVELAETLLGKGFDVRIYDRSWSPPTLWAPTCSRSAPGSRTSGESSRKARCRARRRRPGARVDLGAGGDLGAKRLAAAHRH